LKFLVNWNILVTRVIKSKEQTLVMVSENVMLKLNCNINFVFCAIVKSPLKKRNHSLKKKISKTYSEIVSWEKTGN